MALVLFTPFAADLRGELLLEDNGVELHGNARLVLSGGGTCNVIQSDTSYEEWRGNHGAPMDIWRLDFSVHNGSGRWLDHLIANFLIESKSPDCTSWEGPNAGTFPHFIIAGMSPGNIQESGRNVVAPDQILTHTQHIIVLRGDPEPRFRQWWMNSRFAAAPPPSSEPTPSAEQDTVFWQSIMNSTNPADFKAYLSQFPRGVFRALAQNRLAELRAPGDDSPAANRFPAEVDSEANHGRASQPISQSVPAPQRICKEDGGSGDPPCWMELASHPGCYLWRSDYRRVEVLSVRWTGGCAEGRADGRGRLRWVVQYNGNVEFEGAGLLRGGMQVGSWVLRGLNGDVLRGPYEDGDRHGFWVTRRKDGTREEGHYVNGKRHGPWKDYTASGEWSLTIVFEHGELRRGP